MNPTKDNAEQRYKLSTRISGNSTLATPYPGEDKNRLAGQVTSVESGTLSVVDRKNGMLDRWFPTSESKAKAEGQLALIKTETEFRERMLLMLRDSQLQTMRENYDVYLKQLKVEGRGSIAVHIAKKLADLQTAISEQTDRVIGELQQRHQKLDEIKISSIRAREEQRLDHVLDSFYSTTQKLVNDFTNIVHEDVKSE
jgi:hypothetical protein